MKKKVIGLAILALVLVSGLIFAQDVCNFYTSGTPQLSAQLASGAGTKDITINVLSYVRTERIMVYQVDIAWKVNGNNRYATFGEWDIGGQTILEAGVRNQITVSASQNIPANATIVVKAKTCN